MAGPDPIAFLRAVVEAHAQPGPSGGREPILYLTWMGGGALQHHAQPASGWPEYDLALIEQLRDAGCLDVSWGDPLKIAPTDKGRRAVEAADRASSTEPVAALDDVLAAVDAQSQSGNPLAWPAVRPVLVALRDYWVAGGFSPHGIAMPAFLHGLPEGREAMFEATIRQLVAGEYLHVVGSLTANSIPMEVALTDRAHSAIDGWPGAEPEELGDNLLAVLTEEAAATTDDARKRRLLAVLSTLKELGVATAGELLGKALAGR